MLCEARTEYDLNASSFLFYRFTEKFTNNN